MNVKRIKARTAREALAMIRQSLGDEAVILSNRTVPGGVEIMAMPSDELLVVAGEAEDAALRGTPSRSHPLRPSASAVTEAGTAGTRPAATNDFARLLQDAGQRSAPAARRTSPLERVAAPSAARAYHREAAGWSQDDSVDEAFEPFSPAATPPAGRKAARPASAAPTRARGGAEAPESTTGPALNKGRAQAPESGAADALPPGVLRAQSPALRGTAFAADEGLSGPAVSAQLAKEIAALRNLVEDRLAAAGNPSPAATAAPAASGPGVANGNPVAGLLASLLEEGGFSTVLARRVTDRVPANLDERDARDWLETVLVRNLKCAREDQDPVTVGGTFALVGPTGVGKTTTLAKLAARAVVRHGPESVALISADTWRVGAQDQLDWYARMLGLPVRRVRNAAELRAARTEFADRRLVLIDTAGMSQRDAQVAAQQNLLREAGIRRIVLLNAAVQAETLDDVVRAYLGDGDPGNGLAIVTKLDEAVKLGGVVDCAIRRKLGLLYVTTGQRVPEDLHPAHARYLIDKALRHARPAAHEAHPGPILLSAAARPLSKGAVHA